MGYSSGNDTIFVMKKQTLCFLVVNGDSVLMDEETAIDTAKFLISVVRGE